MGGSAQKLKRRRPRRCVGCGEELPKGTLLRVVRSPGGEVSVDPTGRAPGRGAYLCRKAACVSLAKKRNAISRALKQPVDAELYARMEEFCLEQRDE